MSRRIKLASAAVVAAIVETGVVWVLTHVVVMRLSIAFAIAFAAGYVMLFTAIRIVRPCGASRPIGTQLRTHGLYGVAVLLLVEVMLYICVDWLNLNLTTTNTVALIAVACWVALGWPFLRDDACPSHYPPHRRDKA